MFPIVTYLQEQMKKIFPQKQSILELKTHSLHIFTRLTISLMKKKQAITHYEIEGIELGREILFRCQGKQFQAHLHEEKRHEYKVRNNWKYKKEKPECIKSKSFLPLPPGNP